MAFEKVSVNQLPKRKRTFVTHFEQTPEWLALRSALAQGLKPSEAFRITFTPEDKAKYKIKSLRTCSRFVKKYIQKCGLDYTVTNYRTDAGEVIVVKYLPVLAGKA